MTLPPSKKTRALLAYLVSTGRPQTRERLCDMLWEGPDDPRAALRWSLTKLRPLLDEADATRLVTDRERIAFAAHGAVVDVTRLAAFASTGVSNASIDELRTAAGLFTGEFADGLDLPTCFRFHEWCAAEREKWAALRQTILSALIERLHDLPEEALIYARNRAALDALDETGHIAVIQLLTTLGRQREALRHYGAGNPKSDGAIVVTANRDSRLRCQMATVAMPSSGDRRAMSLSKAWHRNATVVLVQSRISRGGQFVISSHFIVLPGVCAAPCLGSYTSTAVHGPSPRNSPHAASSVSC